MKRINIDYGIDLGTTNSAIARIDGDSLTIIKSLDDQKDTTSSCVAFNKKGVQLTGSPAFNLYGAQCQKMLSKDTPMNAFVEFKRTMGTDASYHSSFKGESFSSEHLSSKLLNYLQNYVADENVDSAVITIPAAYTMNQIDAVRRAADLAGFKYIETLQEPVAAAMAYGVEHAGQDGFWLVFDFGGGTFDAALIKVDHGMVKVIDSAGDNHLGGKDLDYAIIDKLIIPHIEENFEIQELLADNEWLNTLRTGIKQQAEIVKNQLSFQDSYELCVDEEELCEDDDGEDIEIDLIVTKETLAAVLHPIFQRAIDLSLELLRRNNLTGDQLASLVLVGGPTLSPVLREMLAQQIKTPDTSVDPMTVVARGAAIYASTVALPEEVVDGKRDRTKIQLAVDCESSSVEETEFATIKILADKTDGAIPDSVFAQLSRGDGSWTSEKIEINTVGGLTEVNLVDGKTNLFSITLFGGDGNRLECEPSSFSVIHGSVLGSMPLPHNIGVEIMNQESGELQFASLNGLAKNSTLPATGTYKGQLKTQKDIRPGVQADVIKIPLYQGDDKAEGSRAINNDHIYDVVISGNDLPKLLPAGSAVELIVEIDTSQKMRVEAFFPYLEFTYEVDVPTDGVQSVTAEWLSNQFDKANHSISESSNSSLADKLLKARESFEANPNETDNKIKTRDIIREILREQDHLSKGEQWPKLEAELKERFERLEKAHADLGDADSEVIVRGLRGELAQVISAQDIKAGEQLSDSIFSEFFKLTKIYQLIRLVRDFNDHFDTYDWKDRYEARTLVNQGLELIQQQAGEEEFGPLVSKLFELMPETERSQVDDSVLIG